jgi:hypothetical protein
MTGATGRRDGRRDFDFLAGTWRVRNRKLRDPAPGAPADWVEFDAEAESQPILGGLGNVDTYYAPDFPGRGKFHGFALRLYDPATGLWRIWWASSAGRGRLDPPLAGRFTNGEGHFEGEDHVDGYPVKVRFRWSEVTAMSARWQQLFSFDGGRTLELNWVMEFSRTQGGVR